MYNGVIVIDNSEYKGDFDLEATMYSGQTSQPPFKQQDGKYYEIIRLGSNVLVALSQDGLNDPLHVEYYSQNKVNKRDLKEKIFYIFDLDYDITGVYDFLEESEKLGNVYSFNRGLRLYKAQFPFESIISSICSANNSIKRWTNSISQIRENHGEEFLLDDNKYYLFPTATDFIDIPEEQLKQYGVGYRSSYMLESTQMILDTKDYDELISSLSYDEAFSEVIKLTGVGPKVADCILLYGYNMHEAYPVDVWISRITRYFYFNGKKVSNKKIASFAKDEFGEYSGYVQLYLFNYARLSGLLDELRSLDKS